MARLTREKREQDFLRKVKDLTGEEYTVLSRYTYNNKPVVMRHEVCKREFKTRPSSFTSSGSRCRYCAREAVGRKNSKILLVSHEKFENNLKSRQGRNTFELLSEYKGSGEKIKIRHNCDSCGYYEGWVFAGQLLQKGCPSMKHKKKKYKNNWIIYCEIPTNSQKIDSSHEAFIKKVFSLPHKDSVEILSEYINSRNKIDIKCLRCNTISSVLPQQVVNDTFCRSCGSKKRNRARTLPPEVMMGRVDEWFGVGEYTMVNPENYIDSTHHSLIKHERCGHEWMITMTNLTRGFGCPRCSSYSKGEIWITELLEENNVEFKTQQTFPDLSFKKPLRFDFSILDSDGNIKLLLEYNGVQHYREVPFFAGSDLSERRERDTIKMKYAKNNNIPLFIIPFMYDSKKKIKALLTKNKII